MSRSLVEVRAWSFRARCAHQCSFDQDGAQYCRACRSLLELPKPPVNHRWKFVPHHPNDAWWQSGGRWCLEEIPGIYWQVQGRTIHSVRIVRPG